MAPRSRSYEDYEPAFEWVRGESLDTLFIVLPGNHLDTGFKKNHVKVQVEANGFLTVAGERPLEGKRWLRFWQEFEMPDNCDVGYVRAKFQGEKLYFLFPKLITPADDDDAQTPPKVAAMESPPGSGRHDAPRPNESSVVDEREENEEEEKKQQLKGGETDHGSDGMGLGETSKITLLVNVGVAALFFFLHCIWIID
ncbi:Heat shock family protein [Musa troglodytarum]|uniref:Heat shock family protein n=1 Tax=Musa troglodytarum TaxID=320322 RepID=A0A9E7HQJ6_9LILI|nr:Heat shock family protein [Musa troglodytarum]